MKKNKMNYLMGILLLLSLIFGLSVENQVSAANNSSVVIDGKLQEYPHSPVIKNGATFIPFREAFELLGAKVTWNGKDKTLTAKKGNTYIWAQLGNGNIVTERSNGHRIGKNYSARPQTINGVTMVPVKVFEQLGATVSWNAQNKTIEIKSATSTFKGFIGLGTSAEEQKSDEVYKQIEELSTVWANALKTRDGKPRYKMMSEKAKEKFKQEQINRSGENWNYIIGDSSPWVVDFDIAINGMTANITYVTQTSEYAYYNTKETLTFIRENGKLIVDDYQINFENQAVDSKVINN
ncbi:copper amine oxidase N-terminal domain-containing protein [Ureibacillus sp. GCM10028918]|uniref:copper amine oxidase N-terminal domain-containing protein n=1 Tax=Ureibacillus sp. GCM10028918 TaxID=3273429 RepID=UPI00361E50B4